MFLNSSPFGSPFASRFFPLKHGGFLNNPSWEDGDDEFQKKATAERSH